MLHALAIAIALNLLAGADANTGGVMTADQLRAAGFTQLSADNSLVDWDVKPWHERHWTIKDGVINYDGKGERQRLPKELAVDQEGLRRSPDVRRMAPARKAEDEAARRSSSTTATS